MDSNKQLDSNEKMLATLAHVLGIFVYFVGPLIIYLVAGDEKPFAKQHAKEALNFQLTLLIGYLISGVLTIVFIGVLGFIVLGLASIVFSIIAAIAANDGKDYQYPVCIRLIK